MPFADHPRQCAPALRGSGQRHAAPVRARVRRRLARVGAADALLRAALSLHHLFVRAAITPSDVPPTPDLLRLRAIPRRRDRGARSSEDRQGAHLRPLDGRLRDAVRRHEVSAARAVADARRHRIGLGALAIWRNSARPRRRPRGIRHARVGGRREDLRHGPGAHPVRGEGPARLQGILRPVREPRRRRAPPTRCAAIRSTGRRSTISRPRSRRSRCRR